MKENQQQLAIAAIVAAVSLVVAGVMFVLLMPFVSWNDDEAWQWVFSIVGVVSVAIVVGALIYMVMLGKGTYVGRYKIKTCAWCYGKGLFHRDVETWGSLTNKSEQ